MRPLATLVVCVAFIAAVADGCDGRSAWAPTPGYTASQVLHVFGEHGVALRHARPLETHPTHLTAVLTAPGTIGRVTVLIYRSSKEARSAAKVFYRQYDTAAQRRQWHTILVVNVFAIVFVGDRIGAQMLEKTEQAMAAVKRLSYGNP